MLMSQRMRSGSSWRAFSMPSAPLMASMTSKPFCFSARWIISRNHSSSSMTKILFIRKVPHTEQQSCPLIVQPPLFAFVQRYVFIQGIPDVNLAGAADPALGLLHDFFIVGNPARHAADGEHDREHFHGNTQRTHDNA